MNWLIVSILISVLLTVVLNVAPRFFSRGSDRATRRIDTWAAAAPADRDDPLPQQRRVKIVFPWKAMLIGSLLLTVFVNALARLG